MALIVSVGVGRHSTERADQCPRHARQRRKQQARIIFIVRFAQAREQAAGVFERQGPLAPGFDVGNFCAQIFAFRAVLFVTESIFRKMKFALFAGEMKFPRFLLRK